MPDTLIVKSGVALTRRGGGGVLIAAANAPAGARAVADYLCTGTSDNKVDHLVFAAALAATPAGGKLVLSPGDFWVSAKTAITIPNITIEGQGHATVIHADGVTGANVLNSTGNVLSFEGAADGGCVRNLKLDLMGTSNHGIVFNAVDYCKVESCWVTSTLPSGSAGMKALGNNAGVPARFITFQGNFLSDCGSSIALDFEIEKASVFGNVIERAKGDIGSGISVHDLTAATGATGVNIVGNVVSHTHHGIVLEDATDSTVVGNTIVSEAGGDRAIGVGGCVGVTVSANTCIGLAAGDIAVVMASSEHCTVVGNHFRQWSTGLFLDALTVGNIVKHNTFKDVAAPHVINGTLGAGNVFQHNVGIPTEMSGTATVVSGQTSVAVTHGLAFTPALAAIAVTPTNAMGNAAKFWVSTPTATTFVIHVDVDPGAGTATFAWQAQAVGS